MRRSGERNQIFTLLYSNVFLGRRSTAKSSLFYPLWCANEINMLQTKIALA